MEDTSSWEIYFLLLKKAHSIFLVPAVSQVTLVQNNPYAKVTYLGVACPAPHQREVRLTEASWYYLLVIREPSWKFLK